ncbi:MAG: YceI family protein [Ignavibacteriaceae bacterium]|jgi:polyisoprenoid-binding protein YceI|nr:YceI family protein [Ignavibacteriaceae bacterium]
MKAILKISFVALAAITISFAQGFKVSATGEQTFNFEDKRNQATFFSTTPLEDVTGISNGVSGKVTFNVSDIKTLKGSISIPVSSLDTGIELRNEHLKSSNWMDAESYPNIIFEIKGVSDVKVEADNKLSAKVTGDFTVHGVTRQVVADATITYLVEGEQTKQRAPGDLLGVQSNFNVNLSDYDVENMLIGQKVAEEIEININMVGSNAK